MEHLNCALKPETLSKTGHGLPFLGYRIFPRRVILLQKSKRRFIKKMKRVHENYHSGFWDEATCYRRASPLLAFANHADTQGLKEKLMEILDGMKL